MTLPPPQAGTKIDSTVFENFFKGDNLQSKSAIGLVRSVSLHSFCVADTVKRSRDIYVFNVFKEFGDDSLIEGEDIFLFDKAHLEVQLSKLGLAIGSEIFISEAFSDLKIFVTAADHEKLFECLWRLLEERKTFPGLTREGTR